MIRAVVADDQELVRTGFVMILSSQPDIEVVGQASDGHTALDAVAAHRPDVVLLDIRMPEMDGVEAARRICARYDARVIMLTTFDSDEYVFAALRAGASGFLLKDIRGEDLVHAVRVAVRGQAMLAPAVTRRLIDDALRPRPRPRAVPGLDRLTEREHETLGLLGRGLSNPEIAATMGVSEHTVKTHVSNVLSKLGLRDRVQAVIAAYESGILTPGS